LLSGLVVLFLGGLSTFCQVQAFFTLFLFFYPFF